ERSGEPSERRYGSANLAPRGALLALLLQAPADELALQLGQIVDEELAFEVIHLVLDTHREHTLRVDLERLAVAIERMHANSGGALELGVDSRERQAPLLAGNPPLGRQDLRIDEHHRLIARLAHVEHQEPLVYVDLARRQPYTLGPIHGLKQIVHQAAQRLIE